MIRHSEDAHSPAQVRHHVERDEAPGSRLGDPNVVPWEGFWCSAAAAQAIHGYCQGSGSSISSPPFSISMLNTAPRVFATVSQCAAWALYWSTSVQPPRSALSAAIAAVDDRSQAAPYAASKRRFLRRIGPLLILLEVMPADCVCASC